MHLLRVPDTKQVLWIEGPPYELARWRWVVGFMIGGRWTIEIWPGLVVGQKRLYRIVAFREARDLC